MSNHDVRGTETWNAVEKHFLDLHGPAFGTVSRLLEPTATPDGAQLAFTGAVLDALEGHARTVIALVVEGQIKEISSGGGSSRLPRFSPDGSALAFLSDRAAAGQFQPYVLGLTAFGEASLVTTVPGTVEYFSWSPDGTTLLLGVAGLGADLSGGQGSGTTSKPEEDVPAWMPQVDSGAGEESWRSAWVVEVASGDARQVSPAGLNVWESVWLGNGALLAITSPQPEESDWYAAPLTRIGLDGAVSTVTTSEVQLALPSASPSGSRIAVVEAVCSDRWVVAGDLFVGAPDALERVDTAGIDITQTQWIDESRLGLFGLRGLESVAAVFDVETGKTSELWTSTDTSCGGRYPEGLFLTDGRALIVEEGYRLPQQVVVLSEAQPQVLVSTAHAGTDHMLSINGVSENVAWSAPDGQRIEGILCKPEGEGPFPLVVMVHGGPVWAYRNVWQLYYPYTPLLVSRGYAVLNPNPRGSGGRGQDFARQVFGEMGGDDTYDFLSGVDALVERGIADPDRLAVMGGSYGGYMSSWLVTQDQRFAAAVPQSPVTNWYSQHFTSNIAMFDKLFLDGDPELPGDKFHTRSPVAHASKVTTPCLNIAGALDRCTPPTQALEFHTALLEHGVPSTLVIYPQEGHGVRAFPTQIDQTTRILDFFGDHL